MNMLRKTSGFTLIELMITISIITIIASLVVPAYQDFKKRQLTNQGTISQLAPAVPRKNAAPVPADPNAFNSSEW